MTLLMRLRSDKLLVVRNLGFGAVVQLGNYGLGFLIVPYLIHVLGPLQFGALSFSVALNAYAYILIDWGFSLSGTRAVAASSGDEVTLNALFFDIISAKLILAIVTCVILSIIIFETRSPPAAITAVPALVSVIGAVFSVDWFVQGQQKMGLFAGLTTGARAFSVLLILLFVHGPKDVTLAAILQASTSLLSAFAGLSLLQWRGHLAMPRFSIARGYDQLWKGRHYFVTQSNAVLWTAIAPLLLNATVGILAVGQFAAADKINKLAIAVLAPVATVMYPRTTALLVIDRERAARNAGQTLLLQLPIAIGISVALGVFAGPIVLRLLGNSMAPAIPVLQCIAPAPFLITIHRLITTQMLLPLGRATEVSRAIVVTTIASLGLLGIFGIWLGAPGVAIAFVLTELVQVLLFTRILILYEREYLAASMRGFAAFPFKRELGLD